LLVKKYIQQDGVLGKVVKLKNRTNGRSAIQAVCLLKQLHHHSTRSTLKAREHSSLVGVIGSARGGNVFAVSVTFAMSRSGTAAGEWTPRFFLPAQRLPCGIAHCVP
jgi:hypothetical protein